MPVPDPLDLVTPLLLTYNEEANITRTLDSLRWAKRILVIDSGSDDKTLPTMAGYTQVEVIQRPFDTHANQWNFGLAQIRDGWVLSLDADYLITPALRDEIAEAVATAASQSCSGYRIPFRYCVQGRPLRGTILPPRIALFRAGAGVYVDDGHTQDLQLTGRCGVIREPILHDDRKPLSRWLWAQNRYLRLEADKLLHTPTGELSRADQLRKQTVIAPFAVFFLCLFWHRAILDGWRGWFYSLQRLYVETLLSLMVMEGRWLRP